MFLNRVKQAFMYMFSTYKENLEVAEILSEKEFEIFKAMENYEKVHSNRVLQFVKKNNLLKDDILYLKLALLHDCGKNRESLLYKALKVFNLIKPKISHADLGFKKLKYINMELAKLVKEHHTNFPNEKMKEFQKIDDK